MKFREPKWMDENDALDAIKIARRCADLPILEAYLHDAKNAGVACRPGEVHRAEFIKWLDKAFRGGGGKVGRPRKWDWDGAIEAATQFFKKNGIPNRQADLEIFVQKWLSEKDAAGNCPAIADIRPWVAPVYRGLKGGN